MGAKVALATIFFEQGAYGWSETHGFNSSSDSMLVDCLNEAKAAKGLVYYRGRLLGGGATIKALRCSISSVWRDSLVVTRPSDGQFFAATEPTSFSSANPADNPYSCTVLRFEMKPFYRKLGYLSGFPQSQQNPDDTVPYDSVFRGYFNDYIGYLAPKLPAVSKWGTLVSTKPEVLLPTPNVDLAVPPTYILAGGVGSWIINFNPGLSSAKKGMTLRLLGIKAPKGEDGRKWNGVFRIKDVGVGGTIITLEPKVVVSSLPNLDYSAAYGYVITQEFKPYSAVNFESQTHRKRGRPFGSPRGRSPARS